MHRVYLSRRNLQTLLSKLDRAKRGQDTERTIMKRDTVHPEYPCSVEVLVTAVEDADYYKDREPGRMHPEDEAHISPKSPPTRSR